MSTMRTCDICGKGVRQEYGFMVLLIGRDGTTVYTGNELNGPKDRAPIDFCVPCFEVFARRDWQGLTDRVRATGIVMEDEQPDGGGSEP